MSKKVEATSSQWNFLPITKGKVLKYEKTKDKVLKYEKSL